MTGISNQYQVLFNSLPRYELPVDRPQLVAQFGQTLRQEFVEAVAAFGQHLAIGAVAAGLDREDEPVRRLVAPFAPAIRLEGRIIGAVDLDGRQFRRRIFQLALLHQSLGIEDAPPRFERPAADADMDGVGHGSLRSSLDKTSDASDCQSSSPCRMRRTNTSASSIR